MTYPILFELTLFFCECGYWNSFAISIVVKIVRNVNIISENNTFYSKNGVVKIKIFFNNQ
jgi:hypothetical protein